ncbi:protocadherin Fat 4-like isoform X3 [Coccinella septempunctata]|uniref:protocadherin Fat 4-like isoform X3 n=1 Tax=Coccinella septempunctata TaxID=41139 RepID=UPI001D05CFCB|nr:protocadherin Fat 4-like isoform X3 [Coccinella septempunctata]
MSKVRYRMFAERSFLVLLVFNLISSISNLELSQGDAAVTFEKVKEGYYTLTLDENLSNVTLFYIKGAYGTVTLQLLNDCTDIVYGSTLSNTSLYLNQYLDYEKEACRDTKNIIKDQSGMSVTFEVKLNNLDDNAPQFKLDSNNCEFKENTLYSMENSTCQLTMRDLDGMMEQAQLSLKEGDKDLFAVDFYPKPSTTDIEATIVIYLEDGVELDYETRHSYVLVVEAKEPETSGEVQIAIDVKDQPDQPPKFTQMITTEQFEENVNQTFKVSAIDGDIGINSSISYDITNNGCEKFKCIITISEIGEIQVKNVDREETGDTIQLTIEAVEEDDNSATPLHITFFIIDQDDESPEITMDKSIVEVVEGYKGTITKFSVEDMDLGDNGTFSIIMDNGESSVDYAKAFELIPDSGYQHASFSLTVIDSNSLDYENEDWKEIKFNIIAIETANESHMDSKTITIKLLDINDEPPIFVNESDSVDIPEDIKAGETVFNAIAIDKDAGDIVSYEIVGIWGQKLDISENGLITTKSDNTFDYEQQQQVMIAIKASDNDTTHITTKTLTINVLDVDDEPPVMRITISTDDSMAKIPENSKQGTVVEGVSIVVSDPDTEPLLVLEIDWKGTYVTKNSRIVKLDDDIYQCFAVQSTPKDDKLEGTIIINDKCEPDFEKFDAIVLFLVATDKNTKIGDDSTKGSVLINIEDLNDNIPSFIDSSLKDLTVTDGTNAVTKIGVVTAQDDDIGDELTFTIQPVEGEPEWVDIDEKTGELTVKKGVTIDCDSPKRDDIQYYITVHDSDPSHDNKTMVSIRIEDVNDNVPKIIWNNKNKNEVHIEEQSANGTMLTTLSSIDLDRDDPFNRVIFKFESTNETDEVSNRFSVSATGNIVVNLRNGAALDRDAGPAQFILPIVAYDNPKGILQLKDHLDIKVILDDLDNHIPTLETKSLDCMEDSSKGATIGDIIATDPDEDGKNSNVFFELASVEPLEEQNAKKLDSTFLEINKDAAKTATVKLLKPLKGYWGKYNLNIWTKDEGNPDVNNTNIITFSVEKFNFDQPIFDFPKTDADKMITVDMDLTNPKGDIILTDATTLKKFEVNDKQDHKWDVTFEIKEEDGGEADLFRIIKSPECNWKGALQITRSPDDTEMSMVHSVTIHAYVKTDMKDGEAPGFVDTTIKVKFFSFSEQPKFDKQQGSVKMEEGDRSVLAKLPQKAHFANMDDTVLPYYFIFPPSDTFEVDLNQGTIGLLKELDYEQIIEYDVKIVAMNKKIPPVTLPAWNEKNYLNLTIKVIDMNDHSPVFNPSEFTGAFLRNYQKDTVILTVNATDADPTLQNLKFHLTDFDCSTTLKAPDIPFKIGETDGKITNQFTVTSDMSGFCTFYVVVVDEPDEKNTIHTVNTTVQINVITDDELVKFTFINEDWFVSQELEEVTSIIEDIFKDYDYRCYLADLHYDPDWHNSTAHFFFVNNKAEPVPAVEILGNLTDPTKYSKLSAALEGVKVHLYYFSEENQNEVVDDYLKIWLIVTIFILGSLLALITIIFFFRNRALTRRINNLSTTKFGSQESGLNRAGVTAPTTNRNAIEGSNPVFNSENYIKEVDADRQSVLSGDSDLLGVENNPDFDF